MSRAIASPHAADIRIGVQPVEHAVFDRADAMTTEFNRLKSEELLGFASKAAAAALRAKPDAGMGARRKDRAIEAAALLLRALNLMEAGL